MTKVGPISGTGRNGENQKSMLQKRVDIVCSSVMADVEINNVVRGAERSRSARRTIGMCVQDGRAIVVGKDSVFDCRKSRSYAR